MKRMVLARTITPDRNNRTVMAVDCGITGVLLSAP